MEDKQYKPFFGATFSRRHREKSQWHTSAPSPKSLWFRRRSVGCFSRRERSAHPAPFLPLACMAILQSARKWSGTGRASNAENQPTGRGPWGCVENGPAVALLVSYVPPHFVPDGRKKLSPRVK